MHITELILAESNLNLPRLCLEIERLYTKHATFCIFTLGFNRV